MRCQRIVQKSQPKCFGFTFVLFALLPLLTFTASLRGAPEVGADLLASYVAIQKALAADKFQPVPAEAQTLLRILKSDSWKDAPSAVCQAAEKLSNAKDIWSARLAFKELSTSLIPYLKSKGVKTGRYVIAHCPMVDADWIQEGKDVRNPYYGSEMLECGEVTGGL